MIINCGINFINYREIAGGVSNLRKRHVNVFGRHFEWRVE